MSYLLNDDIRGCALVASADCLQRHGVGGVSASPITEGAWRETAEALDLDLMRTEGLFQVAALSGWGCALESFMPGPGELSSSLLPLLVDDARHGDLLAWFNLARPPGAARAGQPDPWRGWLAIQILDALITLQPVPQAEAMLAACEGMSPAGRNRVLRFLLSRGWVAAEGGACVVTDPGRAVWRELHDLAPLISHLQALATLRLKVPAGLADSGGPPPSRAWQAVLDSSVAQCDASSGGALTVAVLGAASAAKCHDLFDGFVRGGAGHGLMVLAEHGRQADADRGMLDADSLFMDELFGALQTALGQSAPAADELLLLAAGHGLFPRPGWSQAGPALVPLARLSLHLFEHRPYLIRLAAAADLPALWALEQRCWGAGLQSSEDVIGERMRRFPQGQLVLEVDGQVAGAMYSQRIRDPQAIMHCTSSDVQVLHDASGNVIQLLAVNVLPELQDRNLGDQLLEFMLLRCGMLDGVRTVVAVTRCKDRAQHPEVASEDYIGLRNSRGRLMDSVLRFHELHGATIRHLVPGYRPADHANEGHGVLVEYDIRHRRRDDVQAAPASSVRPVLDRPRMEALVQESVQGLLAKADVFAAERPLMEMGLDSADLLQLAERLSAALALTLTPTFFFKFNTGDRIVEALLGQLAPKSAVNKADAVERTLDQGSGEASDAQDDTRSVAIVGVACRLPGGVHDLDGLWDTLSQGRETIGPLPSGRWAWPAEVEVAGRHRGIDRGSFVDDIDCFDAEFFRITPREAELMDPQQRILLELSWACFEDAGHSPRSAAGSRTGVYVGASGSDYQHVLSRRGIVEPHSGQATSMAILANRISYFFDLNGPSLQIDTACSSSLVAVHEAVRALRDGTCTQALVAGIHVMLNPATTMAYYKAGMLSPDGRCKTFDEKANGYVRGEGAVMVLLKTVRQARLDGDRVYAVIRGSAVNHGGQAGGLTVPHPSRQADLLVAAVEDARIGPERLGYLEAHGTGTPLGDPIEVQGIKEALGRIRQAAGMSQPHPIGLGSIKTNLGHLEAAAGLAGLLKVVLAMRHSMLPASLNCHRLNPQIELGGTGLHVIDRACPWVQAPGAGPRVAGISSFGSGGTNAHLVIEEAIGTAREPARDIPPQPVVVVLSARDVGRRHAQAARLLQALQAGTWDDHDLADIAYTLRVGRDAMPARLACVAGSLSELTERLARHVRGDGGVEGLYVGEVQRHKGASGGRDTHAAIDAVLEDGPHALAQSWVRGGALEAGRLDQSGPGRRLSLPTYPFAKERHWVSDTEGQAQGSALKARLHPLLHENTSTFDEQRFSSHFSGREHFLKDHVVQGQKVLPGVAQIEMAREAARLAFGETAEVHLQAVVFARPVIVGETGLTLHVSLAPRDGGQASFDVRSERGGDEVVHTEGRVVLVENQPGGLVRRDIDALQAEMAGRSMAASECYATLAAQGLAYGPSMQALQSVVVSASADRPTRLLAQIAMPEAAADGGACHLPPSLLDAALQAALVALPVHAAARQHLPFAVDAVRVHAPLPHRAWVVGRAREPAGASQDVLKWDLDVLDLDGHLCAELAGFAFRQVQAKPRDAETMLMRPVWRDQGVPSSEPGVRGRHWILVEDGPLADALAAQVLSLSAARLVRLSATGAEDVRYAAHAAQLMALLQELVRGKPTAEVLIQLIAVREAASAPLVHGLAAMFRSARQEDPRLIGQVLEIPAGTSPAEVAQCLAVQAQVPTQAWQEKVRYHAGRPQVEGFELAPKRASGPVPLSEPGGVYLITGGAGGVGLALIGAMVASTPAITLVLTGRSALDSSQEAELDGWRQQGACVQHEVVDVTDSQAMQALVQSILAKHGRLDGVLHSAGVVQDSLLVNKTQAGLAAVLAPKVAGLVALDHATREVRLSYFVAFSSISSVLGNLGQADYAAANGFMDACMARRQEHVGRGLAHGRSLAVNWPLWAAGGMRQDEGGRGRLWRTLGLAPLPTSAGVQALTDALGAEDQGQVIVLHGLPDQISQLGQGAVQATAPVARSSLNETGDEPALHDRALRHLTSLVARQLKLPLQRIDATTPLDQYGVDSVLAVALINAMETDFGDLPKTLLFEHPTLDALAAHLVQAHRETLVRVLRWTPRRDGATRMVSPAEAVVASASVLPRRGLRRSGRGAGSGETEAEKPLKDIAVIGMTGRFAQAPDLEALWEKLLQGADCVTEVPAQRWDHALYFDAEKGRPGKSYCRWGGFIDGIDEFDPLFFNMSPAEAAVLDPQCRLWLQVVAHLLEDAGHTRRVLARHQGRVGMYVGSMYQQYRGPGMEPGQAALLSLTMASTIANRASHCFGLEGPSIAVDTMCSSSIVAVLQACKDLQHGDCDLAIAGGVNLTPHPDKYVGLSQWQYLASDGERRSFSQGDGYLPSEGVGAVLLKPLARAQADGDDILAVIKGGASVHNGRAQGYGVPSLAAQARVMSEALRRSGVDPATVGYVEAAANGSAVGDAIEVAALAQVFAPAGQAGRRVALGAVKSNLGHPEAASGMAQLAKVILQMRHRQLVPTIKSDPPNPDLRLMQTPFVLQREVSAWPALHEHREGQATDMPRRALINAFGAGGSCASLVVEEYRPAQDSASVMGQDQEEAGRPEVMVFSARNRERLAAVVSAMLAHLDHHPGVSMANLAHALQSAKEAHEVRLALVVEGAESLVQGLKDYLDAEREGRQPWAAVPLFTGDTEEGDGHLRALLSGGVGEAMVRGLVAQQDLGRIALYWTQGGEVDWALLQAGRTLRKVSLPAYPFARERCWALGAQPSEPVRAGLAGAGTKALSPPPLDLASVSPGFRQERVAAWLRQALADALRIDPAQIRHGRPLRDLGVDSVLGLRLMRRIAEEFEVELSGRDVLAHDTVDALTSLIAARSNSRPHSPAQPEPAEKAVHAGELGVLEMLGQGLIDLEEANEYFQE